MQKTKLGISVGLMGAGLYLIGLFSFIPAFLLAAYVLLREDNEWLRRTAVRVVIIITGFYVLRTGVDMLQEILGIVNNILGLVPILRLHISFPLNLDSIADYAISLVMELVLIVNGFKALSGGSAKVGFADKIMTNHVD